MGFNPALIWLGMVDIAVLGVALQDKVVDPGHVHDQHGKRVRWVEGMDYAMMNLKGFFVGRVANFKRIWPIETDFGLGRKRLPGF